MTTVGRWSPNKVRARVLDGTWVSAEELGGMVLLTPTSIAYTGTSATVGANGSVEFTGITSLSLNGVFSADYDNYRVMIGPVTATAGVSILCRLRVGGVDNSTASSYVDQQLSANGTSVSGTRTTHDLGYIASANASTPSGIVTDFYGPYLAQPTAWRSVNGDAFSGARILDYATTHNQSTSYDGFTFSLGSGNPITGLVSVYGLVGA